MIAYAMIYLKRLDDKGGIVQNVVDYKDLIVDLGADNTAKISKEE